MADISDSSWSEVDGSNTGAPPTGWPPNMPANQVEPTSRAMMGAIKRFWDRNNATITTTGASGIYVWTPTSVAFPTVLVQGEGYAFRAHQASVGADVFNPNGLGPKPLYKPGAVGPVPIAANDFQTGGMYVAFYDGTIGGTGAFQTISGALPTNVRGRISGIAPAAGFVGEYKSSIVLVGSAAVANSNTNTDITTLSLTAGDWDVWGEIWVSPTNAATKVVGWINTASVTNPATPGDGTSHAGPFTDLDFTGNTQFALAPCQALLSATTTYYLGANAILTAGTANLYGKLCARRRD